MFRQNILKKEEMNVEYEECMYLYSRVSTSLSSGITIFVLLSRLWGTHFLFFFFLINVYNVNFVLFFPAIFSHFAVDCISANTCTTLEVYIDLTVFTFRL